MQVSDAEEKAKLTMEMALVAREKFEEDERKKKIEEEDDSKFDYMTLLVNSTKRHGNIRKGAANSIIGFKHSNTKKITGSASI